MNRLQPPTGIVLSLLIVAIAVYDFWLAFGPWEHPTFSVFLMNATQKFPWLPSASAAAVGFLFGHIFSGPVSPKCHGLTWAMLFMAGVVAGRLMWGQVAE